MDVGGYAGVLDVFQSLLLQFVASVTAGRLDQRRPAQLGRQNIVFIFMLFYGVQAINLAPHEVVMHATTCINVMRI